jgi:hypothetical protein
MNDTNHTNCRACSVHVGTDSDRGDPPIIGSTRCRTIDDAYANDVGICTDSTGVSLCRACYEKALAAVGIDLNAVLSKQRELREANEEAVRLRIQTVVDETKIAWGNDDLERLVKLFANAPELVISGVDAVTAKLGRPPADWSEYRSEISLVDVKFHPNTEMYRHPRERDFRWPIESAEHAAAHAIARRAQQEHAP